jgi:glycosyltransferase involved in cell wall biosynthesis
VTLLVPGDQQPAGLPDGVEVLAVPPPPLQGSHARWLPLAWRFARTLGQIDAGARFDIVHFTDARESLFFSRHRASVGNVNDTYAAALKPFGHYRRHYVDGVQRWLYYRMVHQLEGAAIQRLRAVIANSDYTLHAIREAYHLDPSRLHRCFKCIDLKEFAYPPRTDLGNRSVLFAGGNFQRKGLPTLIRAAPTVLHCFPDTRFRVVGADPNLEAMRALCREYGVETAFEFVGQLPNEELRRLYRQAGVFVLPSLVEAFGVAMLEAMASETPVVAARVGGIPELVVDGENGVLVEPDNPGQLAAALVRVLGQKELALSLARAGRQTAKRFGIDQMLACTFNVYERLLAGVA